MKQLRFDRPNVVGPRAAAALLLLLLTACQPERTPVTPDAGSAGAEEEVRAASVAWDSAHNVADVGRLMALYADSAVSMPYSRPALEGHAAIEADFRAFFADYTAQHTTTIVSLEVADDWAMERGRYVFSATPKAGGAPMHESGKHVVVRKRTEGAWKVQWEIWNTDGPPAEE